MSGSSRDVIARVEPALRLAASSGSGPSASGLWTLWRSSSTITNGRSHWRSA